MTASDLTEEGVLALACALQSRAGVPFEFERILSNLASYGKRGRTLESLKSAFFDMQRAVFEDDGCACVICGNSGSPHLRLLLAKNVSGRKLATVCARCATGTRKLDVLTWRKIVKENDLQTYFREEK